MGLSNLSIHILLLIVSLLFFMSSGGCLLFAKPKHKVPASWLPPNFPMVIDFNCKIHSNDEGYLMAEGIATYANPVRYNGGEPWRLVLEMTKEPVYGEKGRDKARRKLGPVCDDWLEAIDSERDRRRKEAAAKEAL